MRGIRPLRERLDRARSAGQTVALVPTMGALHDGHLALVREAGRVADLVVATIFVNPMQFGPDEDFRRYPRDIARDGRLLAKAGCDIVFVPSVEEVYPPGFATKVAVEGLKDGLCGRSRPGHFDGVATVVLKLLNMVRPDVVLFGEKDYQQLVIIRRMVRDLDLTVRVVSVPVVRDKDGLAMSSRNSYLSAEERSTATSIFKALELARLLVAGGERRSKEIEQRLASYLLDGGVARVEYVSVVDPDTLAAVPYVSDRVRIAVAAWVGRTRLIDNILVDVDALSPPKKRFRRDTVCLILAAGEGKRMKSGIPKVLHQVGGRPMVRHVVDAARSAGVRDIIAIVGDRSEAVEPVFAELEVATVKQDVQRGTGHAVLQAYPVLHGFKGSVLVLSGDVPLVRPRTVKTILDVHAKHSNAATFGTAVVPDSTGYGRILRDESGSFVRVVEERDADADVRAVREINGGIYCFRASALFDAILWLGADNKQMEYYLTETVDIIKARGGLVEPVVVDDYTEILGVNTPQELALVRRIHARRRANENDQRGLENGVHYKSRRR